MLEIKRFQLTPVAYSMDGNKRIIRGVASVFYNPLDEGTQYAVALNIVERIDRAAFNGRLKDDVIATVDHDPGRIVGRSGSNLDLAISNRGLEYTIALPDSTEGNDLWANVQAGIIRGSSFRAIVDMKNDVEWSRDGDNNVMTIRKLNVSGMYRQPSIRLIPRRTATP